MAKKRHAVASLMDKHEKEYFGSRDDRPELRTPTCRARIRNELSDQVQAFLSRGGQISRIQPNVMADPPRKPSSNYGDRPL